MNRATFAILTILMLIGVGAGESLSMAQTIPLRGAPYPQGGSCTDDTELSSGCNTLGRNLVTLYPYSTPLTAEDLCSIVGSDAIYVRQMSSIDVWTYFCPSSPFPGTCIAASGASGPKQAAPCTSDCFCLECYEGVDIRVAADVTVTFAGTPAPCSASLAPFPSGPATNQGSWWVATPDNFPTYQAYANATCLATGLVKGSITCVDPVTGVATVVSAGTPAANAPFPNALRACRLRNPSTSICYNNPGNYLLPAIAQSTNSYCIVGDGNGTSYAWWIDLNVDGSTTGDPFNVNVAGSTGNANALAQDLFNSINSNPDSVSTGTSATVAAGNCVTITNASSTPFNLWVAPANTTFPGGCGVTASGCSYNPTIILVPGPISNIPTLGSIGIVILTLSLLIAAVTILRRRQRETTPSRAV